MMTSDAAPDEGPRAEGGDAPDWPEICVRYARLVYSIPRRFGLPHGDCDDVYQATWLTAVRRADPPREETHLVRWLAAIASWETRNLMRRRRSIRAAGGVMPEATPEPSTVTDELPECIASEVEAHRILIEALRALTDRDREIIEALFLSDAPLSYDEVAARLGVRIGSVGPLRMRALGHLRDELVRRHF